MVEIASQPRISECASSKELKTGFAAVHKQ